MTQRLFVYGTLMPGRENAHQLADIPGDWAPATVNGRLYPQGWGAALGYPGLVLDDNAAAVEGQVLTSDALPAHWDRLDRFEGVGYDRVLTTVKLNDGTGVEAYFYAIVGDEAAL